MIWLTSCSVILRLWGGRFWWGSSITHLSELLILPPKLNGTAGIPLSLCSEVASSELSAFAIGAYSVPSLHCSLVHIGSGMVLKRKMSEDLYRACDKGWVVVSNPMKSILITNTHNTLYWSSILTIFPVILQPRRHIESLIIFCNPLVYCFRRNAVFLTQRAFNELSASRSFLSRHFSPHVQIERACD